MGEKVITSPVKAIRAYCLGCCYGSDDEVRQCTIHDCELYPFRFGKNPFTTRTLTAEQRAARSEHARKVNEEMKRKKQMENVSSEA